MILKHKVTWIFIFSVAFIVFLIYVNHIFATRPVCANDGTTYASMYKANENGFFRFAQQFGACTVIDVQTSTDDNPSGDVIAKAGIGTKIFMFFVQLISRVFGLVNGVFA